MPVQPAAPAPSTPDRFPAPPPPQRKRGLVLSYGRWQRVDDPDRLALGFLRGHTRADCISLDIAWDDVSNEWTQRDIGDGSWHSITQHCVRAMVTEHITTELGRDAHDNRYPGRRLTEPLIRLTLRCLEAALLGADG